MEKIKYEYASFRYKKWSGAEQTGAWFNELAKEGWEPMFPHPTDGTLYFFRREIQE